MEPIANALDLIRHSEKEAEAKSARLGMADLRPSPANQHEFITCLACPRITHKYRNGSPPVLPFSQLMRSHSKAIITALITTSISQSPNKTVISQWSNQQPAAARPTHVSAPNKRPAPAASSLP
jgi:hypothetical protein